MTNFIFDCNGKSMTLHGKMIEAKGVNLDTCLVIAGLHRIKDTLIEEMKKCDKTDRIRLHTLYSKIRNVEFWLQDTWGFVRDETWHRHWEVPHCTCLAYKNECYYPHSKFISPHCNVHGDNA